MVEMDCWMDGYRLSVVVDEMLNAKIVSIHAYSTVIPTIAIKQEQQQQELQLEKKPSTTEKSLEHQPKQ